MLKDDEVLGAFVIYRQEVRPFTDKQIELVTNFASQAVIAIENTRLLNELRESLQQQTTTADVLKVISRSAFDLQKVLDTLVQSAANLCDSHDTAILQRDGDVLRIVSHRGHIASVAEGTLPMTRKSSVGRAILNRQTVHLADAQAETDQYPVGSAIARQLGFRTILTVPLIGSGEAVGAITLRRPEVRPFTDRQIELLQTFADQAVIAIENARLFEAEQESKRELQQSLEQQTATADVLKTISRSALDLQKVLDTLVESATRLCRADMGLIRRKQGEVFPLAATFGMKPEWRDIVGRAPGLPGSHSIAGRAMQKLRTVQSPDVLADPEYTLTERQKIIGMRAILVTPLMREGQMIGYIAFYRLAPGAFTDKQVELIETFADQAVIAIENARLFEAEQVSKRDLQESLAYQTATGGVLDVISRSPNELQPVLDTIVQTAQRLCQSDRAQFFRLDNGKYRLAAYQGTNPEFLNYLAENPISTEPGSGSTTGKAARERRTIHVGDSSADPEFAIGNINRAGRGRSVLAVPLLRNDLAIGVITVARDTIKPFTGRQIELIETFADQAMIAIENTRLFEEVQARNRELSEALEQQTATSEVLKVIGRSTFDLQPVLETLVENVTRLCGANTGVIFWLDGEVFRWVADYGATASHREFR
jgi:GAF domain-containing protein